MVVASKSYQNSVNCRSGHIEISVFEMGQFGLAEDSLTDASSDFNREQRLFRVKMAASALWSDVLGGKIAGHVLVRADCGDVRTLGKISCEKLPCSILVSSQICFPAKSEMDAIIPIPGRLKRRTERRFADVGFNTWRAFVVHACKRHNRSMERSQRQRHHLHHPVT